MAKIKNKSTVPQGMLAPNGYVDTYADPDVQATTRPPGMLLAPSPGYDSVRQGKNRFQGRGPTGGFRPMTFAEDVGGSGAALSVIPGETSPVEATEWLAGGPGRTPEGTVLIADRELDPGYASNLHEGSNTLPDMGDRHPDRPLSKMVMGWVHHPLATWKREYSTDPLAAVLGGIGLVALVTIFAQDYERNRGGGVSGAAEGATGASGDVVDKGVDTVTDATKKSVDAIEKVTNDAITAIADTGRDVTNSIKNAAS